MMTAATTSRSLSAAPTRRAEVGWIDLAWLVWRQHRLLIAFTTLGVAIMSGLLWWDASDLYHASAYPLLLNMFVPAATGVAGVFWGAPLLAGEYEQKTNLLVWSQDTSRMRWLTAKLVLLGVVAAILWGIIGLADTTFIHAINAATPSRPDQYGPWLFAGFESWIPLQVIYALFGFALGLAASAVLRRTVPAMAATLVLFTVARFAIGLWRPTFLTPLRYVTAPAVDSIGAPGVNSLVIGESYTVDAAGTRLNVPQSCFNADTGVTNVACARSHGVVATYVDYQPASRLLTFHLIEFGIFAVLTAALITITVLWVRKNRVIA